jgi:hypothetical protein
LYRIAMLPIGLECFRQRWNTFLQGWYDFYRVGMLSTVLECFLQGWNASYRVGMPPIG